MKDFWNFDRMIDFLMLSLMDRLVQDVLLDGVFIGSSDSVVGRDESVLHYSNFNLSDFVSPLRVVYFHTHSHALSLEADIPYFMAALRSKCAESFTCP